MLIYGPCHICGLDIYDDCPHSDTDGEDIHAACCEESGPCSITFPPPTPSDDIVFAIIPTNIPTNKENTMDITATRNAIIGTLKADDFDTPAINRFFADVANRFGYEFDEVVDEADLTVSFTVTLNFRGVSLDGQDVDGLDSDDIVKLTMGSHSEAEQQVVDYLRGISDDLSVLCDGGEVY